MTETSAHLFDLDGTLADTLADIAASTNHVRAHHGLPAVDLATARTFVGDGARTLMRRALAGALPADDGPAVERAIDAALGIYREHHEAQCTATARLYPGVPEHLTALRVRGMRLAVVTNKPERFAVKIVRHLGLAELLPVVVGGDTLPLRKPDPAPLREALARLGAVAAGSTMVGDGPQDVRPGKALGMRTIGCLYGYGGEAALRAAGPDVFWRAFGVEAREA